MFSVDENPCVTTKSICQEQASFKHCTVISMKTTLVHTILLIPGTRSEAEALAAASSCSVEKHWRLAEPGGGWTWRVVVPPNLPCRLNFQAEGDPDFRITDAEGKPLVYTLEQTGIHHTVSFTTPTYHPPGDPIHFIFQAKQERIAVRYFNLLLPFHDGNQDGISDWAAGLMGCQAEDRIEIAPIPTQPHTSFFYAWRYDPAMALPTDAVRLYFWATTDDPIMFPNWAAKGYQAQTMLHSRFAGDLAITPDLPDVQRDRYGRTLGVHVAQQGEKTLDLSVPFVTEEWKADVARRFGEPFEVRCSDYYRVPNPARDGYAARHYAAALEAGATGFGYDEPEFWTYSGYSDVFKQEWLAYYGTPWQAPHSSIDARYQAEQLKGHLFTHQIQTILQDVARRSPSVTRLLSAHSPINYYLINITCRHHQMVMMPEVQEVIAEVWTGTARVPVPLAGEVAERTFEVGFLEYSSFYQLTRGLGKRLWFLHDPLEDRPNLPMEDYHRNYVRTIVASLMFPAVDNYEVLVWPNRIYGCVPKEYETLVNTVVGALCELWRYPAAECDFGSQGIATFVADSMGWQRDDPSPSDYNDFWGLTLPLIAKGIPLQVLSLDRSAEAGYLDDYRALLVCYDFLKPTSAQMNQALADWVKAGGTLLFFGGADAYNALQDSWWRLAGFASPGEDLLQRLGLPVQNQRLIQAADHDLELHADSRIAFPGYETLIIPAGKPQDRSHQPGGSIVLLSDQSGGYCQAIFYEPPAAAQPLYYLKDDATPLIWEAKVGQGTVIFAGVSPRFMAVSSQGAGWLSALAKYGYEKSGAIYREQPYFRIQRGPYTAISALDQAYHAQGCYIDLLTSNLAVLENPTVSPHECAFWLEAQMGGATPRLLAVAGRTRAYVESSDAVVFLSQSPTGSEGAARLWSAGRQVERVSACTILGKALAASYLSEGQTILVRYANDADGAIVRVQWQTLEKSTREG